MLNLKKQFQSLLEERSKTLQTLRGRNSGSLTEQERDELSIKLRGLENELAPYESLKRQNEESAVTEEKYIYATIERMAVEHFSFSTLSIGSGGPKNQNQSFRDFVLSDFPIEVFNETLWESVLKDLETYLD